jgi:hypothetical protein
MNDRTPPWAEGLDGYDADELAGMLLAAAGGLYAAEAAVTLLAGHQTWLLRADFRRFITVEYDEDGCGYAAIDWIAAIGGLKHGQLPCSGSEANILRIAASLASGLTAVNLGQAISGLDARNLTLVLKAIAHASGYRNAGVSLG